MGHGIPKEVAAEAKERGLVNAAVVCKQLKISRRTLGRMIRMKEIDPVMIGEVRFFDPEVLSEFDIDENSLKEDRDYVLDYALDTMVSQAEHIDKLIKLSHVPAQETIKALLEENNSLRKRAQDQEKTVVEVHTLYGELLRETMLAEVEAEKQRANIRMKEDALTMVRDKLFPLMLENFSSTKFLSSFTDAQIEAFIEAGAGTDEQISMLRKLLAKRKKEKKGDKKDETQPLEPSKSRTESSPE